MLHRREAMMRLGQMGLGALSLPGLLHAEANAADARRHAKSCIYLFLWGGPPQQDLWDLKPDAPTGIRSLFSPIRTNVPDIHICDQMPRLARHMDKVAVIRSLTHDSNIHEPSVYRMLTGKYDMPFTVPRNQRQRSQFPFVGSVVSHFSEPGVMPACVTIPRPIGHDGVTYAGTHAGFLGPRDDPMEFKEAPIANAQATHPVALADDMNTTRLLARRGLLNSLEDTERRLERNVVRISNPSYAGDGLGSFFEQAFRMLSSPATKNAFNLNLEPATVRDRYGRNEYGESMLLARRLIEAGVRLVTINWMYIFPNGRVSNVWDNHAGYGIHGARTGYDLLKSPVCIPPLDQGLSALLEDLSVRGLLEETLLAVAGEFGRTPNINNDAGRDHWGACQAALLAGGGIRGGQIHGSSDSRAAYPRERPVAPQDFIATMYHALGLAPDREIHDRLHRPYRICDGTPLTSLFG
jgi:hypothetical protein